MSQARRRAPLSVKGRGSLSKRASVPLKSSTTEDDGLTISVRPANWSCYSSLIIIFITGDEPNELIPEAYDKLNAFYTENEKRINKRGEALAYVLSTGDIRVNNYAALEEFLRRLAPVGWCLRKVARVHPFVKGTLHSGNLVGNFHSQGRAPQLRWMRSRWRSPRSTSPGRTKWFWQRSRSKT
jgi:hypothetical protein